MKKTFILLGFILGLSGMFNGVYAQGACTPTTDSTAVGLYPNPLPDGMVNVPYDEVVDFVMFKDTLYDSDGGGPLPPFQAYVCSFELLDVPNIPGGMTFACGGPTLDGTNLQKWNVNHTPGYVNKGCVRITGTPDTTLAATNDTLYISVNVAISLTNPSGGTCSPITSIPAQQGVVWHIVPFNSIEAPTAKDISLTIAPNPAQGNTRISFKIPQQKEANIQIVDLMGRTVSNVYNGIVPSGTTSFPVNTQSMSDGIYLAKITFANGISVNEKFIVKN